MSAWVGFSKWQLIRPDGIINDLSGDVVNFFGYYNVIILFLWNCFMELLAFQMSSREEFQHLIQQI
ncbi:MULTISPECIES: hypothetical protein [unclassified Bartonella]|uniref:hypothetical protein n=1 Tax=unclassified Bartonella TaxID=2645622 RepID=UPI0035D04504